MHAVESACNYFRYIFECSHDSLTTNTVYSTQNGYNVGPKYMNYKRALLKMKKGNQCKQINN